MTRRDASDHIAVTADMAALHERNQGVLETQPYGTSDPVADEKSALKVKYRDILAAPVVAPAPPRVDPDNPPELVLLRFERPREMVEGDL